MMAPPPLPPEEEEEEDDEEEEVPSLAECLARLRGRSCGEREETG